MTHNQMGDIFWIASVFIVAPVMPDWFRWLLGFFWLALSFALRWLL